VHVARLLGATIAHNEVWKSLKHSQLARGAATSRRRAGGIGFIVPHSGRSEVHKVEGSGGKSRKMAFPGHGDNRVVRRHGNVCIPDWHRVVGFWWTPSRAVHDAGIFPRNIQCCSSCAARIAERPVLVTFNGKTFDWPLLESRYLMTRCIRVRNLARTLDLLHPGAPVWKLRLGSVRLVELERHVLDAVAAGWDRQDDVPSSMIPQFYFDYLRGRSPLPLAGVVRHNAMDLRGLAALFGKLNSLLDCKHGEDTEATGLVWTFAVFAPPRGARQSGINLCGGARSWPASAF